MSLDYFSGFWFLVLYIIAVIIHELGHYIAFRFFGRNPSLKFHWWGVSIGDNIHLNMNLFETGITALAGVFVGLVYVMIIGYNMLTTIYILSCGIDLLQLYVISSSPKGFMHKTKKEFLLYQYRKSIMELESK